MFIFQISMPKICGDVDDSMAGHNSRAGSAVLGSEIASAHAANVDRSEKFQSIEGDVFDVDLSPVGRCVPAAHDPRQTRGNQCTNHILHHDPVKD